ncbi:hypothetical protein SAMN05192561_12215 [Halopenitus malekzadehii]|uniref:Uncharacterized protein n=1 Tax=Halopenitus malekzadehii TaxID=1267564 RepID=A0A1H6K255_9EURY|nr:hypothetical protein [Halopenitus malekzadehii]SEH65600.1 hypothetical protein SAMN05192561_12215 [Halopenitus malekzadehii]
MKDPCYRNENEELYSPGVHVTKWLRCNLSISDHDVEGEIEPPTPTYSGDPNGFVL